MPRPLQCTFLLFTHHFAHVPALGVGAWNRVRPQVVVLSHNLFDLVFCHALKVSMSQLCT